MSEFSQGARPLVAATIGNMCGALSITTYTQSFFVGPVTEEFGWSQGQFFLGFTLTSIFGLIAAPMIGSLAIKYGIRPLAMIGLVGHALGYMLFSLNPNSLILWYLTWGAFTFLVAGSLPVIWTSVLNSWFTKGRGKAVGITMAGSGVAAFFLPPIAQSLINDFGWRAAYQLISCGALALSLPIVFFWFHEKDTKALAETASTNASWGMSRKEAIRTRKFWNLAAVLFLTVFAVIGMVSNFKPLLISRGADPDSVAGFAALMGVSIVIGRLLIGALVDKFWAPAVACLCFGNLIVALLVLLNSEFSSMTGVLIAVSIGLATGAELDLLAFLTSKYFGPRNYAEVFGGIFAVFGVGAGLAPPVFGELATQTGSYTASLYLAITALALAIPLFLSLGRYPREALDELSHA